LTASHLRHTISNFFLLNICFHISSLTRGWACCLKLSGPRQRRHSRVWVPRESWHYFTVSDSRLLQPGGPDPHIYIHQEQSGLAISPGTGFPFVASYGS
jgi:hypothetical protein